MELSREELLLTSFELDKHNCTKADYQRAKELVYEHEKTLSLFLMRVRDWCHQEGLRISLHLQEVKKGEDEVTTVLYKKCSQALTRAEHTELMKLFIEQITPKITIINPKPIDDSSRSIFKKLYLKERAFQQREDLYNNKR